MQSKSTVQLIFLSSFSFLNTASFPEFATSCLPPDLMASSSYVFLKYNNPFPSALKLSLLYLSRNSFLQILCLMCFSSFVTLILSNSLQIFIFLRIFIKEKTLLKSHGEGKGYPLQYSGLENSLGSIVRGVAKSWIRLSHFHFHFFIFHFDLVVSFPFTNKVLKRILYFLSL